MRDGKHEDGAMVLRAKIDMASPNINMRDPAIYRIRRATHHNTGDTWCIYPMYTFAHPIEDALEQITHSICTLEFEDQRPFYDWLLDRLMRRRPAGQPPPKQYEFARLNLTYVITSKRKLAQLVYDHKVSGWDDPRMPTIVGLRRRGYTPAACKCLPNALA
jgi:glutaminyl-tRNA synthetase